eukprot:10229866-Karenia_brevis.AAC.1
MLLKKQRVVHNLYPLSVPTCNMSKICVWAKEQEAIQNMSQNPQSMARQIRWVVQGFGDKETPYGPAIAKAEAPWGTQNFWHPCAALWLMSQCCPSLGTFMRELKRERGIDKFTVVLYEDSFKVGNVLRPDKGRALDGMYWTVKEWPTWLRVSHGYIPFAYFPDKLMKENGVHTSWPLEFFCTETFNDNIGKSNASKGILMQCKDGTTELIRFHEHILLSADEVQLCQSLSLKGANGKSPCI